MTIESYDDGHVLLVDKHKNIYTIPTDQLEDIHLNDAYDYILKHQLMREEVDRYQYSNLMLAQHLSSQRGQ